MDTGSVFAERFHRTLKDLFKKPVFDKASANWIDELVYVLKKSNNSVHSSIKVTSKQASRKSYEEKVFYNTEDKRQKQKPKYRSGDIVREADVKKVFSKGDSTSWSYKLYTKTQIIDDTFPSYRINYLSERNNEKLLGKSKLSKNENDDVWNKLKIPF